MLNILTRTLHHIISHDDVTFPLGDDLPSRRHKSVNSRRSQTCCLAARHRRFGSLSAVVIRVEVEEERSVGFRSAVNRSTIAFSRQRNRRDAVLKVARRNFDVLRGPRPGRPRRGSFHSVSLQSTIDSNGRIARTKEFGAAEKLSKRYVTDPSPRYHSNAVWAEDNSLSI